MKCEDCGGEGFKEYDAGLLVIGCKACSGIGKVDEALTKEEFERAYAFRSDVTPDQVTELGLIAMPSDCVEGWAMEQAPGEIAIELEGDMGPPPDSPRELKPGEYQCSKCGKAHRASSKLGKKHLELKV